MKERIQELALEARLSPALLLHHWGKVDALTDSEQEVLEQIEKFAELIVRECARVAKEGCLPESDDYNSGRTWAGIDVLKHFGVKE